MSLLSYIKPILLYEARTQLGSRIVVSMRRGKLRLTMNGHPQSSAEYVSDWKAVFKKVFRVVPHPAKLLLLGLGGGDIIKIVHRQKPTVKITAVEWEKEVANVAKKYFGITVSTTLKVVVADAKAYMARNKSTYDIVVVDLYSGDQVPHFVESDAFLQRIVKAMHPGGCVVFNYASHNFTKADFAVFETKLRSHFSHVKKLSRWGHTFYLAE